MAIHRFIGDREAPTPIASIRARRPLLGTGKLPAALSAMARTRTLYAMTDSNRKPTVDIDPVGTGGKHLWKIQVPVSGDLRGARPGMTLERHPASKFLKQVKNSVSFKSHRLTGSTHCRYRAWYWIRPPGCCDALMERGWNHSGSTTALGTRFKTARGLGG